MVQSKQDAPTLSRMENPEEAKTSHSSQRMVPVIEYHIADQGSPNPLYNAAGLLDVEVYHTVNYIECENHYHGQASNSVSQGE